MPKVVQLLCKSIEDIERSPMRRAGVVTLNRPRDRLEVVIEDVETGDRVICLPLREAASWLRENGYRWQCGSQALWERVA